MSAITSDTVVTEGGQRRRKVRYKFGFEVDLPADQKAAAGAGIGSVGEDGLMKAFDAIAERATERLARASQECSHDGNQIAHARSLGGYD